MGNQLDLLQELSMATPAAESSLDAVPSPASAEPAPVPVASPEPGPTPSPEPTSKPSSVEIAPPASLLILDTETTGLEPESHACLEVGAILFDVASARFWRSNRFCCRWRPMRLKRSIAFRLL